MQDPNLMDITGISPEWRFNTSKIYYTFHSVTQPQDLVDHLHTLGLQDQDLYNAPTFIWIEEDSYWSIIMFEQGGPGYAERHAQWDQVAAQFSATYEGWELQGVTE